MNTNYQISYIEFPSTNLATTKEFFSCVFGWQFKDFGDEYITFTNKTINGGFFKSDKVSTTTNGSALTVMYSDDLEYQVQAIIKNNGIISKEIFSFPGGKRFHFLDPNGNEYAVWSE